MWLHTVFCHCDKFIDVLSDGYNADIKHEKAVFDEAAFSFFTYENLNEIGAE